MLKGFFIYYLVFLFQKSNKNTTFMKKIFFLFFLTLTFSLAGIAQDKTSDLKKLLELMDVENTIENKFNSMIPVLKQQVSSQFQDAGSKDKFEKYIDFMMEETKELSKKLAGEEMLSIYDKHFSHQEIKDLIKFYESPTGKKILEKTPQISADMMQAMTTKYLPQFQERLRTKLEELK